MTLFKWTAWHTVKHQIFDFLLLVGMRDRLRCPRCKAVGTWKPHGGWLDLLRDQWTKPWKDLLPGVRYATDRRWLCKYCGHCLCWKGEVQGYPNRAKKVWDEKCEHSTPTPKDAVEQLCGSAWPWRG